jgi:hypothetical protein
MSNGTFYKTSLPFVKPKELWNVSKYIELDEPNPCIRRIFYIRPESSNHVWFYYSDEDKILFHGPYQQWIMKTNSSNFLFPRMYDIILELEKQ